MIRYLMLVLLFTGSVRAGIDLRLPTENHHLFTGEPEKFYMYVERTFEGEVSKPWEGGSFGMVRNAVRMNNQMVLTKFHEGIDISPMNRDKAGNPLDQVTSIADGQVVHVSPIAGRSNYGKYVVVEHTWDQSAVYSLYAHLSEISCKPGDVVKTGSVLGQMGFTGAGIDRTRAHVHVELGMMLSRRYDDWCKGGAAGTNYHGPYNGMNLIGADVAAFFLAHKDNPEIKFSEFVTQTPAYFKVLVPSHGVPDFVVRYPWILRGDPQGAKSWEISFSALGLPVAFAPSQREVTAPVVTAVHPSTLPQRYLTRNLISGQDVHATLTSGGKQLITLITDDFPVAREQAMERKPAGPKS